MTRVAIVHPGQMGVSVAAAAVAAGHAVAWASEGRSPASVERANKAQLSDRQTLHALCADSDVVLSVCPPDQAIDMAKRVVDTGYQGLYLDCNAVAPATGRAVADIITGAGGECVDAGIIGPPAWNAGTTRLYLSGPGASRIQPLFESSVLDARVISDDVGAASALKMAYAGWTKGSAALLMTMYALARQQNVNEALREEWALSQPGVSERMQNAAIGNAPKAWRFVGEMREIQATLDAAGLPGAWFDGAANTYDSLAGFKNGEQIIVDDVIDALIKR